MKAKLIEDFTYLKPKSEDEITQILKDLLGNQYEEYLEAKKLVDQAFRYVGSLIYYVTVTENMGPRIHEDPITYDTTYGFSMRGKFYLTKSYFHKGEKPTYDFFYNFGVHAYYLVFMNSGLDQEIKALDDFKERINDEQEL